MDAFDTVVNITVLNLWETGKTVECPYFCPEAFCRVLKSAHFLRLIVPNGIRRGRSQSRFHQVNPTLPKPPYDHMAQAIDNKKAPYGTSMSFQYGVDGNRHGAKNTTEIIAPPVKTIPANPCPLLP